MRSLVFNGVCLLDLIDSNHVFVTELAIVGCITSLQKEHIIGIRHPHDRNDKLLNLLARKSVADCRKFMDVLSIQQAHLIPLLFTDGGEKF